MIKNFIIIALTLLLSITTGFSVVAWKMNRELVKNYDHCKKLAEGRFESIIEKYDQIKSLKDILRKHRIDIALMLPDNVYIEAPPAMTEEEFKAFKDELRRRKEEAERQFEREQEQPQT